jgi:hypothetical protein
MGVEKEYWPLADVEFEFGTPIGMATMKMGHDVLLKYMRPEAR